MVDAEIAATCSMICCDAVMLGLGIFYIVALAMNPEVSEIGCGKVMWYTSCIGAAFLILVIPASFAKREQLKELQNLQDPTEIKNTASTTAQCITCLICIGITVNNSLLLDQVLNITSECRRQIEGYTLFWHAAQIQAYCFLGGVCLVGFVCCCGCCCICLAGKVSENWKYSK